VVEAVVDQVQTITLGLYLKDKIWQH